MGSDLSRFSMASDASKTEQTGGFTVLGHLVSRLWHNSIREMIVLGCPCKETLLLGKDKKDMPLMESYRAFAIVGYPIAEDIAA